MERKKFELYIVDFTEHTCRKDKLALFKWIALKDCPALQAPSNRLPDYN